jgi:three-Cys-motif partner protein
LNLEDVQVGGTFSMSLDEIGYWSELKLEIVRKYAQAYSKILSRQARPSLHHVYIDGFSGSGVHISKTTGEFIQGSPLNALKIDPPFREYFLIDLDGDKVQALEEAVGYQSNVHIIRGDCNQVLLTQVFPNVRFEDYRRGLCLLDPYGLHLNWQVLETAAKMRSLDLFLNFPIMDMNRNALWRNPEKVRPEALERMNAFWGDDSWREEAYKPAAQLSLYGEPHPEKQGNEDIAEAFRRRLKAAGFQNVLRPLPMRNSKGAVVYYLFFASQKPVASNIVNDIFDRYRERAS